MFRTAKSVNKVVNNSTNENIKWLFTSDPESYPQALLSDPDSDSDELLLAFFLFGCIGSNAAVGLQEFQSVNDVLRPDRQVFVATATLFGLWFGLAHVEIPQYFQVDFDVFGCNI